MILLKVAWISASFSAAAKVVLYGRNAAYGSGNWLDDELIQLLHSESIDKVYFISSLGNDQRVVEADGVVYIDLGLGNKVNGPKAFCQQYRGTLASALKDALPDLIQVWGTETPTSQIALECSKQLRIPSILCPQGLMASLVHFPNGLVPAKEMCGRNPLLWAKMPLFNSTKRTYQISTVFERKAIEQADYILSDNQWTFDYCRCLNRGYKALNFPLPINGSYQGAPWLLDKSNEFAIMSVSSRSAYKGQHVLVRAAARLKNDFDNLKIYFPGMSVKMSGGIKGNLKRTPYNAMLLRLIKQFGLQDNVVFLDRLSPEELANFMRTCRVFVNPSVIESNCMSLREAMCLGMPVVSAFAGSIQEYVHNGENGYLYRYEEDEVLSRILCRLFENEEECARIGANARCSMEAFYSGGESLGDIYTSVLRECHAG